MLSSRFLEETTLSRNRSQLFVAGRFAHRGALSVLELERIGDVTPPGLFEDVDCSSLVRILPL